MTLNICRLEDCDRKYYAQGYCRKHYDRERHARRLTMRPPVLTEEERFWSRVDKTDTCWLWTHHQTQAGYGIFFVWSGGRQYNRPAHRYCYELLIGPIPNGLVLDHLCDTPLCVRPDHLNPTTQRANLMRSRSSAATNARKTHCLRGHPFDQANTYKTARGARSCRACMTMHQRNYYRRKMGLLDAVE